MAEFSVLHDEPRHKVVDFATEILERRRTVIQEMRPQLSALIEGLLKAFSAMKQKDPLLDLARLRVEEVKWTKDGRLALWLSTMGLLDSITSDRYYIDNLVAELVDKDQHMNPCSGEIAQFMSAMIDQFGFYKKHNVDFDLTEVRFSEMRWIDGRLVFDMTYRGEPFGRPETVRT